MTTDTIIIISKISSDVIINDYSTVTPDKIIQFYGLYLSLRDLETTITAYRGH
jgi:hypothetical protein